MNWIALTLIVAMVVILIGTTPSYAVKVDNKAIKQITSNANVAKQLTLQDVFVKSNPSIKEAKIINDLKDLSQVAGVQATEEDIAKKSHIVQELLQTYDELLDPKIISEIQNGEITNAHNIVIKHTEKVSDVVKILPSKNSKDGIVGSVSSLNQLIPKQKSMHDLFG